VIAIFLAPPAASGSVLQKSLTLPLLYLLLIPVIMPSTLAAYSVAGEREQGTLEPLLTTPIRRQEFILGKAAAVMIPAMALSYTVFWLFLAAVRQLRGCLSRVPPGSGTPCPVSLRAPVGRLGHSGWNGDRHAGIRR
jgi:ABC-type Na+ efflux pump permease subunit